MTVVAGGPRMAHSSDSFLSTRERIKAPHRFRRIRRARGSIHAVGTPEPSRSNHPAVGWPHGHARGGSWVLPRPDPQTRDSAEDIGTVAPIRRCGHGDPWRGPHL